MKRGYRFVGWIVGFVTLAALPALGQKQDYAKSVPAEYRVGGFALGCQAYSFNRFTFVEAVDKTRETGCRVMEMYPGQKFSPDNPAVLNWDSPPELIEAAKKKLDEAGVKLVAIGSIGGIGKSEAETRKVFEFAKKMGILTIAGEPVEGSFEMIDKLCNEYGIPFAIHNHPKRENDPNYKYWNPDYILECCKGRSPMIGACADTGHWMRSGLKPVECLKKLEGHIISMHIKDLNEFGPKAHDVPFGTGQADMKGILDELRRQKFDGVMSMEYEYNWDNNVPEMKMCVEFVRAYGTSAAAPAGEKTAKKDAKPAAGAKKSAAKRTGAKKKAAP